MVVIRQVLQMAVLVALPTSAYANRWPPGFWRPVAVGVVALLVVAALASVWPSRHVPEYGRLTLAGTASVMLMVVVIGFVLAAVVDLVQGQGRTAGAMSVLAFLTWIVAEQLSHLGLRRGDPAPLFTPRRAR